jgi:hypothetical protein
MAIALAACGIYQEVGYKPVPPKDRERMQVVYRYFSGTGQIEGMCRADETIITVFCNNPSRYGEVIAPSANGSSRAIGICTPQGSGTHRMTLSCAKDIVAVANSSEKR